MKQCIKKWQIYRLENQESIFTLKSLVIDNYWLSHECWLVSGCNAQCHKLHVMNQLSQEQHTGPFTPMKPYELHLMAHSPVLSHTISPLFSLLCFYCWVRSGPNWLIYSTINWSRAVWLIKTCNRLQGGKRRRGVGVPLLTKWLY